VARGRRQLAKAARQIPGVASSVVADVTQVAGVRRVFATVSRHWGRLDVLVNNAGVFTYKPFVKTTLEEWRRNLATNLTSLFLMTRAAIPLLGRSQNPQIVNILSISSREAYVNCSAYTASKFGALGLTRVLAEELRPRKIRVTAILPGSTNTRMTDVFGPEVPRAKLIQPEDVAEAVLAALIQPRRTTITEILLMPSCGSL